MKKAKKNPDDIPEPDVDLPRVEGTADQLRLARARWNEKRPAGKGGRLKKRKRST